MLHPVQPIEAVRVLMLVACLAASAVAVAAGEPAAEGAAGEGVQPPFDVAEAHAFVGTADGELFVGIDVLEPEDEDAPWPIAAYLCDGESIATWIRGSFDGSDATLLGDGVRIEVSLVGDDAYGSVTFDGRLPRALTATRVTGPAGTYRPDAEGIDASGGWIVLPDGRQRGALTVGGVTSHPTLELEIMEADAPEVDRVGVCCCGLVYPCDLACCRPLGEPFEDWGPPAATPSPN